MIRIVIKHNRIVALRPDDVDASGARAKKRQSVTHSRAHTATRVLCNLFLCREPTIDGATGTRFSDCNGGDSHQPFETQSFNQKLQFACQIIQRKLFPNDDAAFRLDLLLAPPGTVHSSSSSSLFVYAINALMQMQTHSPLLLLLLRKRVCVTNINIRLPGGLPCRRRGSCPQKRIDSDSC